ncbi:MAG: hypothetical protein AUJ92_19280 [Armatimonadetes bacterium CG2_30_59_28]|nr:photosystem P840 reaction-center cytochrome c-551 [Armatimonadota bacterium]OIO90218.1 MAG: hypothetical protein AUJ92_19280 [Armatimonadetes bacterium CG2_30_59_28]PIU61189.1 MAG: hypothetical protein COS85_21565 [Armatimonadetes bacterium CG07_land_8_20_14_0_80_59_28]PIX44925.1 MAG: hypothetical protein COZ56_03205 [Armatimonadetes bacterium CG_4_8_14_3_um_filter_58_9]PIY44626.1 MAG: hypothetical protein COZ05_07645 [Armatimonadetes bacterium CG_4_10_14_3_um_filter_59_10]PJB66514.1 MAG: h
MKSRIWWIGILAIAVAMPRLVRAGGADNKYAKVDKGPKTIDVSKYPKEMQGIYKNDFSKKCSKCHTLARPINTNKKPDEWNKYVDKMMKKPNSGIDKKSAEKIKDFLVYDQKNRKDKK